MSLVVVEDRDRVRVLRLNRPEARNAMNTALLRDLRRCLDASERDEDVRAVVVTGAGEHFSAGADLREELHREGNARRMQVFCEVYEQLAAYPKTTIAAVEGHCVGGGIEVAAACDLRVADPTASFRFPGAALGFPVGAAKLIALVGLGTAKDLLLTSRTFLAEEAHRLGFVQRLVPVGGALDAALELAEQVAAHPPEVVAWFKQQLASFTGLSAHVAVENQALQALAASGGDWSVLAPEV